MDHIKRTKNNFNTNKKSQRRFMRKKDNEDLH
jgi:hypothetical protein